MTTDYFILFFWSLVLTFLLKFFNFEIQQFIYFGIFKLKISMKFLSNRYFSIENKWPCPSRFREHFKTFLYKNMNFNGIFVEENAMIYYTVYRHNKIRYIRPSIVNNVVLETVATRNMQVYVDLAAKP